MSLRVGLVSRGWAPHARGNGIARYTEELARGLHALGHEVHVLVESRHTLRRLDDRPDGGPFLHGVTADVLPVDRRHPETDRQLRWAVAVAARVEALARSGTGLDVVESPNWESQGIAVRRTIDVPLVVRLHSPLAALADPARATDDTATAIALERWLVAHADGVTSSTAGVLATVRDATGVEPARYARIPLGVPPPPPFVVPPEPPRLLFVGRLERRKGIHTLLSVLPDVLTRFPDVHVDVVGEEADPTTAIRQRFEAEHHRAAWRPRCRFHGFVADDALPQFYRDCTVFVAPSLYESFGLVYVEAMRHARPVIGTTAGGIPEVVRDGETGVLVPPGDAPALRDALTHLLADPHLCRRLGERGREVVEHDFSSQQMAERTTAFYAEVIATRRR
jgi:glycosyltransferase involved in cell wall biosynthesis